MKVGPLVAFMKERHRIHLRRQAGASKPWTKDPVLKTFKFCNVYRELDAVSIWIREKIREPFAEHSHLWFALAVARQINWPGTLKELLDAGLIPPKADFWDKAAARALMMNRKARGEKLYTGAYMLNAHGRGPDDPSDKAFFTCYLVLDSIWQARDSFMKAFEVGTLESVHAAFLPHHGWGSFTAAQVVADLKYTRYLPVETTEDWWTWAASGPGSRRGLNVVLGREPSAPWCESEWLETLQKLQREVNARWAALDIGPSLHAQDLQNCLCEYFKYTRGWSRTTYPGAA